MLALGNLSIDPPLFLAPMAGVTDRDFRLIVRRIGGVGVVTMEFISSRAIVGAHPRVGELMHFVDEERPLSIQIYGADVETMARAAEVVESLGADICDINMGCPANKVLKGCAGAALMGDLALAEAMIREVRQRLSIPLTVKFRTGMRPDDDTYLELGRICESLGVDAVAMHARSAKQMFRGQADWSAIARLKDEISIPVIGNGDISCAADGQRMFEQTGCDGIMIGRAATRNPWIFLQTAALLSGGSISPPSLVDRRELILGHFRMVAARENERYALHKLRKFTGWYTHGLPHGRRLRQRINELPDVVSFLAAVDEFFDHLSEEEAA